MVNYKVSVLSPAELDIAEAYSWHEERSEGLGSQFLNAVDTSLAAIRANPLRYPVIHRQFRRALLRRFPFGIFYFVEADRIAVIACFHAKRDPRRVSERL